MGWITFYFFVWSTKYIFALFKQSFRCNRYRLPSLYPASPIPGPCLWKLLAILIHSHNLIGWPLAGQGGTWPKPYRAEFSLSSCKCTSDLLQELTIATFHCHLDWKIRGSQSGRQEVLGQWFSGGRIENVSTCVNAKTYWREIKREWRIKRHRKPVRNTGREGERKGFGCIPIFGFREIPFTFWCPYA